MFEIFSVTSGLTFLLGQFLTNSLPGLCLVWTVTWQSVLLTIVIMSCEWQEN